MHWPANLRCVRRSSPGWQPQRGQDDAGAPSAASLGVVSPHQKSPTYAVVEPMRWPPATPGISISTASATRVEWEDAGFATSSPVLV